MAMQPADRPAAGVAIGPPARSLSNHLDTASVARFHHEGFLAPLFVMPQTDMAERLRWLEELEAQRAGRIPPAHNVKVHLLVPWLWDLVHDPRIIDPVGDLLGPDILCWAAGFFDKRAGEPLHVAWHQDATYWGLSEPRAVTAWVAFTPSHRGNGCMRVSPNGDRALLPHVDTRNHTSMLPGRERVLATIDEANAVDIVLAAGEMSLHDLLLVHGSQPNSSGERRCGLAIRYIPAHLKKARGPRGTATLVRGRDHGNFDLEQPPEASFHPAALVRYRQILRLWMRGVFDEMVRSREMERAEPIRTADDGQMRSER
jgi:non-haem Fe2+, alpha-ketoglutarate-dependent halogenase